MESVRGIYDGKQIIATDKISTRKKYKVIITFIEGLMVLKRAGISRHKLRGFRFGRMKEKIFIRTT